MANRIDAKFEELKKAGKKALVTYILAGDAGYEAVEASATPLEGTFTVFGKSV